MKTNNNSKLAVIVTTLMSLFFSITASAVSFSQSERESLKAGKTIHKYLDNSSENGFFGGSGYTLIDAPPEVVWNAILDFDVYNKVFSATNKVSEVNRKGDRSLIHYKMGYKFLNLEYYVDVTRNHEKYTVSFEMIKNMPHDIINARGYWRLFPQKGGRTLVAYIVSAQIPMGIVNLMNSDWKALVERNLIGAPNDLKIWINSPGGKKYFKRTAKK